MGFDDWTTAETLGGRYVLGATIGTGRTTTVVTADDLRLRREVAVKLFRTAPDEDDLARLAAEAQVLAGLSHPGLVPVFDVSLDTERPYLVMLLVPGGSLRELAGRDELEPADVARLGAHLADVLDYVHARGVVHGEIDTSNVLLDEEGAGYLAGFGTAGEYAKPSGDIYALGTMLDGCLPEDLGAEWRTVLGVMTDPDPDQRPDAARCAEVLRNIASGDTADIPLPQLGQDEAEPPVEPASKRIRGAYAGLVGMGLAVTALAAVVATSTTGTPRDPAGEEQPQVEEPAPETGVRPPGQTYPAPVQRPDTSTPPSTTGDPSRISQRRTSEAPPDEGDSGPGNGNGRGDGNGNGRDDDNGNGNGGLLGGILGGLL